MDTYQKLMEKKNKLEVKIESLELNARLAYWKYKKQVSLLKGGLREKNSIVKQITQVQETTKRQIEEDIATMDQVNTILK